MVALILALNAVNWALIWWAWRLHRSGVMVVRGERDPASPRPCASLNCRRPHPHGPAR